MDLARGAAVGEGKVVGAERGEPSSWRPHRCNRDRSAAVSLHDGIHLAKGPILLSSVHACKE